ncbi:MAG: HAMP domain-containing sensor histidine kinase [Vicingaceae bacterium]|nr:HAMP domain-containing sensor histidine kinase [Vicingaceae bacterium]
MKKQYIYILIGIITSALIGLVVIQLYWIDNAVTLKDEEFSRDIRAVLANTSNMLEKIDDEYRAEVYKRRQGFQYQQTGNLIDSTATFKEDGVTYQVNEKRLANGQVYQQSIQSIDPSGQVGFQFSFQGQQFDNRGIPILDRLKKNVIDSVLKLSLLQRGIKAKYQFGVFDYDGNGVVVDSTSNSNKVMDSDFYIQLFPKDVMSPPHFLTIYFPHKKGYLLTTMWMMLSTSVFLLIIIVWAFTYTIQTIFKQKKLSEVKNDFISNMTHELKTPISTISLACEALSDKDMSNDEDVRANYVGMINQENKRLGLLVESVLKSATWDKGDLKLKKEELDFHQIINEVSANILIQVESRSGFITQKLNASKSIIKADKVHVTNLIYNLLDNANKYSPLIPEITISTENLKEGVLLIVSDKGQGIKRESLNKVFEKFYRVPTGNVHNVKGFGLGLNYVQAIVNRHGGEITASSVYGKGTTFKIFIPFEHQEIS